MDPFSYLSVLLSIILGLGITHMLTAAGWYCSRRSHSIAFHMFLSFTSVVAIFARRHWYHAALAVVVAAAVVVYIAMLFSRLQ
jgi:hypothetical protein